MSSGDRAGPWDTGDGTKSRKFTGDTIRTAPVGKRGKQDGAEGESELWYD